VLCLSSCLCAAFTFLVIGPVAGQEEAVSAHLQTWGSAICRLTPPVRFVMLFVFQILSMCERYLGSVPGEELDMAVSKFSLSELCRSAVCLCGCLALSGA
jgi:hypothetical protein